MTASRRREPPPIVDSNPPKPPRREPPPEHGTSGGVGLTDEMIDRLAQEAEQGYPIERLRPREGRAEDVMTAVTGAESPDEAARVLSGLVGLRRKQVDPDTDYVADGTRLPRYVQAAIRHEAALRGRPAQEIVRDVLLGRRPLSAELLDAHYLDIYGYPREVK